MASSLPNYMLMHRRRMRLSQEDIAFLVGFADGTSISRYENFQRVPTFQILLRLLALFECDVRELFAGEYEQAVDLVADNACKLKCRLNEIGTTGPDTLYKIELLSSRLRITDALN